MNFSQVLSGLTKHNYKDVADEIKVGDPLSLKRDPDNPYDPNAIKVLFGDTHIGWIPMRVNGQLNDDQIKIAKFLDDGESLIEAIVAAHDTTLPVHKRITALIEVKEEEE